MSHPHPDLPRHRVRRVLEREGTSDWPEWSSLADLGPLTLADGRGPARHRTALRVCQDGKRLIVRFDCSDAGIRASLSRRDDPLHQEDVVEVFLAAGHEDPAAYFEFQVNPLGALFDARVINPHSRRDTMSVDRSWNCPGIEWNAATEPSADRWSARLVIPLGALSHPEHIPAVWRANFFRIERPAPETAEFSCWSTTLACPADFHRPERFGFLEIGP